MMLLLVYLLYVSGVFYVVLVIYFGVVFIKKVWELLKDFFNKDVVRLLFKYFIYYMMLLCLVMVIDSLFFIYEVIIVVVDGW